MSVSHSPVLSSSTQAWPTRTHSAQVCLWVFRFNLFLLCFISCVTGSYFEYDGDRGHFENYWNSQGFGHRLSCEDMETTLVFAGTVECVEPNILVSVGTVFDVGFVRRDSFCTGR